MTHDGRVAKAASRRKPVAPRVTSRPELRGSLDRVVARVDARRGDDEFGAAFRAGGLVRRMRREADLSQRALGESLGVSQARISEIEAGAGSQGPTWALMERIAAACGREIGLADTQAEAAPSLLAEEWGVEAGQLQVDIAPLSDPYSGMLVIPEEVTALSFETGERLRSRRAGIGTSRARHRILSRAVKRRRDLDRLDLADE
jgi:transcriptional regulator with XRE-family HTH domain